MSIVTKENNPELYNALFEEETNEVKIMTEEIKAKLDLNGIKDLENYITNLQKENEELKDMIKKDNHLLGCNFSKKDKYKQERDIYKQRNEKAVEYIKTQEVNFVDVHYQQQDDYFEKLLNILKGGDE